MSSDVQIVPYRDGPYLVRGDFSLRDQNGGTIDVSRRTVALCRCGRSRIRPFCDGTHRLIRFRAPSSAEDPYDDRPADATSGAHTHRTHANGTHANGTHASGSAAPTARATLKSIQEQLAAIQSRLALHLQRPGTPETYLALRAAQPLVTAAWDMLATQTGRHRADARHRVDEAELVPSVCLLKGAVTALLPLDDAADPGVQRLADQLGAVVAHLEERTLGA